MDGLVREGRRGVAMGVGLVRNKLDSWWLKYLSVVQDGEGVCLVNISFQAME